MLLWATKAQFSTGPNWASLSFFFLFVYFCLTAAPAERRMPIFYNKRSKALFSSLKQNASPAKRVAFWEEEVPGISEQCRSLHCEVFQGLLTMAERKGFTPPGHKLRIPHQNTGTRQKADAGILAERKGFEPLPGLSPATAFRVRTLRPLGYLSIPCSVFKRRMRAAAAALIRGGLGLISRTSCWRRSSRGRSGPCRSRWCPWAAGRRREAPCGAGSCWRSYRSPRARS